MQNSLVCVLINNLVFNILNVKNMKLNKFLLVLSVCFVAFTSCKNERETETFESVEAQEEAFNEDLENARQDNELLAAIQTNPELSTFAEGLNNWEVEDSIDVRDEDVIVFAPTNMAYSQIRQNTEAGNMLEIDDEDLIAYHIIETDDDMASLREEIRNSNDTLSIATMNGEDLKLSLDGNSLVLTGATGESARVTDSIQAGTGMVYIIDRVLLPRDNNREVTITDEG